MFKLNATKAKKIAEKREKRKKRKNQKELTKALKQIQKEIQEGILTAINNGQYGYRTYYHYGLDFYSKTELKKGIALNVNQKYFKDYYQNLGYDITIHDTGTRITIEIRWENK